MASVSKVEDTRFRVHKHFLSKYSPVLREIFLQHHKSSDTTDNGNTADASTSQTSASGAIRLDGVTVLELEALLTFFYER
jgi:BTB/POZ domain